MESYSSDRESAVCSSNQNPNPTVYVLEKTTKKKKKKQPQRRREVAEEETMDLEGYMRREEETWPMKSKKKAGGGVMLEGYIDVVDGGDGVSDGSGGVGRTKSLTDEDLEELKGCLDLGFGFSYEEIPELCNTLPALELCYSMSQRFLDEQQQRAPDSSGESPEQCAAAPSLPIANWKISSPGDHPEEVKARLKYWAQAVACTVRLCNS